MPAIDFITAFGRLLRDGILRDALAANPRALLAQLSVQESDHPALLQLAPDDLEFQACVLLRKRFDSVRQILPETCLRMDGDAWPTFHRYARTCWPSGGDSAMLDACEFCRHLRQHHSGLLCDAEWNRLQFAHSKKRLAVHWVRRATVQKNPRPALQLFLRARSSQWREIWLYVRI